MCLFRIIIPVFLLLCGLSAHAAGGHWATDDATVVSPGQCELELWDQRRDSETSETVLSPVCNFGGPGDIEWTLALNHLRAGGDDALEAGLGAKHLVREIGGYDYGIGIAGGVGFSDERDRMETAEVYVPFTLPFFDQRMHLHLNAGWEYDRRRANRHDATWAVAMDMELWGRATLIGEVFGSDSGETAVQGGWRYAFARWDATLDMSWLRQTGDDSDVWTTIALNIGFGS